uniref:Uncharacterized protein n=2 Tax=Clastoptera arizonana TaxID=38151 RepID=A0A1B6CZG7_9HEMI
MKLLVYFTLLSIVELKEFLNRNEPIAGNISDTTTTNKATSFIDKTLLFREINSLKVKCEEASIQAIKEAVDSRGAVMTLYEQYMKIARLDQQLLQKVMSLFQNTDYKFTNESYTTTERALKESKALNDIESDYNLETSSKNDKILQIVSTINIAKRQLEYDNVVKFT